MSAGNIKFTFPADIFNGLCCEQASDIVQQRHLCVRRQPFGQDDQ